jgi:threonine dehydrogenase-like Zn-dependent dehydrogenase
MSPSAGALIEPAGCALRAVEAAGVAAGDRLCVWGPGTLGLLTMQFAAARGAIVDVVGIDAERLTLAKELGAHRAMRADDTTGHDFQCYQAVIDTSTSPTAAASAVRQVEPSGRVVLVGIADIASTIDTRELVLGDSPVVGNLAASAGLAGAIELFAAGAIQAEPLIAATVGLDAVADVLAGRRPENAGPGPKIQVDPRM